ncbi:biotinidase-like [Eriocheir sinensis]|uniref:biotinidase-like n=1 Tax=Eriocheir sinensis TaxID=95602 RepID=UPI0021C64A3A|nr:biotinidase-like [Eriocheir sinensis]
MPEDGATYMFIPLADARNMERSYENPGLKKISALFVDSCAVVSHFPEQALLPCLCVHFRMCVWLLYLILMVAVEACEVQYTGAVLELEPYSSWEAGGLAILQENAQLFLEHANFAKQQGADILVFPEYGLTSTNLQGGDVLSLSQVVPCPEDYVVPCQLSYTDDHSKVLGELSCGAAQLQLYLVVDLIEVDHCDTQCLLDCSNTGYRLYNTQVVLDRCGAVVARYRKKHLFLEPEFTAGTEDDSTAIFTTDFGVTFSLQVCFDIMYESPGVANVEAGVRNVAMSTAWVDELPFLTEDPPKRNCKTLLSNSVIKSIWAGLVQGVPWP